MTPDEALEAYQRAGRMLGPIDDGRMDLGIEQGREMHARNVDHLSRYVQAAAVHQEVGCGSPGMCPGAPVVAMLIAREELAGGVEGDGGYRDGLLLSAIQWIGQLIQRATDASAESMRLAIELDEERATSRTANSIFGKEVSRLQDQLVACERMLEELKAKGPVDPLKM